jgi:hypothetical protein
VNIIKRKVPIVMVREICCVDEEQHNAEDQTRSGQQQDWRLIRSEHSRRTMAEMQIAIRAEAD